MFEMRSIGTTLLCFLILVAAPARAEDVDLDMVNRIRDEGYQRSHVLELLTQISDDIGPRLTASPQKRAANRWAMETLRKWGLSNVHEEAFEFGRGWSMGRVSVYMTSPQQKSLHAIPVAWTPGTDGLVAGDAIAVDISSESDFARFEGKLKGKVAMLDKARAPGRPEGDVVKRFSADDLSRMAMFETPKIGPSERRKKFVEFRRFAKKYFEFLAKEGVVAAVTISDRDAGIIEVEGMTFFPGSAPAFPILVMASEPYNQIMRRLDNGKSVGLEINVEAQFYDNDTNGYNVIAEIPGRGGNPEVVMLGAHFDSWHGGLGSVDNGSGSAVVLEAVRILKALDVKPKRAIRIALWSGEEQGHIGSRAYVDQHFATRPEPTDPFERLIAFIGMDFRWPISPKPEHARLSAYFNIDGGSGRIRGVFGEGNAAAAPIFEAWFTPFRDLGADTVTLNPVGGTDHQSFDAVGLPGFQFIQDRLDYETRLHHSDVDYLDYVVEDDMKQAAIIMASFVYNAAMRDERFPRKPMPKQPSQ